MNDATPIAVTNDDLMQAVRESAMLANVTISVWSAERSDARLMSEVKRNHGAVGEVGRVVKRILAGADGKLKDVRSAFNLIRIRHYDLTLPLVADSAANRKRGARLLPHKLFQTYLGELTAQRRKAMNLLEDFLAEYPNLISQAKGNLGSMVNDAEYPTVEEVRASFRVTFDFQPIPSGAGFKGLPDNLADRLSLALQDRQQKMFETARKAMWQEVRGRVEHIVDRLADQETKFKASTVKNVRELITLLPGWNVAGEAEADEVVADIKAMLDGVDATVLRDHLGKREEVMGKARTIVGKLDQWGL